METWMNQSWWLYDLTVLAILVLCIWGGWRRGLIRTILHLGCYLVAFLLANLLATPLSETIYSRFVESRCTSFLSDTIESYHLPQTIADTFEHYGIQVSNEELQQVLQNPDGALDALASATGISQDVLENGLLQEIDHTAVAGLTGLPDWMVQSLLPHNSVAENANRLAETAALLLSDDTESASAQLTENYIQPVIVSFIRFILFFILFLLISAILRVIINRLSRLFASERLLPLNQMLGLALGCLQSALFLYLMRALTRWIVEIGADQATFFQEAIIQKTILFQYIYYLG